MMDSLPFMVNAASPLSRLFSHSPSTQEELVMTRIQMEMEMNKAVALRQQQEINCLIELIRIAQVERDEAKHKCLRILHLFLHRENKLHLSTTDGCDSGNYLSFNQAEFCGSHSSRSTSVSATDDKFGRGVELSLAQSVDLVNNDQNIDHCPKYDDDGLASLLGFEIAEQKKHKQRNMDDVGSAEQHEEDITVDRLAMLFEDEPTQQFANSCRDIPYSLQQPIPQSNPNPALSYILKRTQDQRSCAVVRATLPRRGKLLQSVIQAGPLLKDLLLAGPLPQWKCPPPGIDW